MVDQHTLSQPTRHAEEQLSAVRPRADARMPTTPVPHPALERLPTRGQLLAEIRRARARRLANRILHR